MSLKKHFGKSTLWMSAAASGNSLISFIIFIILSRLLAPEEIGLVAFALILIELGKILVSAGFQQAIVRHGSWDEDFAATCFYLNLMLAALVTLVTLVIVTPLVTHYYDSRAQLLVQVLSLGFLLEGLKAVQEGKLQREFNFRAIALRTIGGSLCAGVVGVILAFQGYGVWALVVQQLLNQTIALLITINSTRWLPRLRFSGAHARSLLAFSTPLTGAQFIGNFASKIYEMLVGLFLGPAALGFFRVGGRALFILQEIVLKPFEQTLLPALARINQAEQRAQNTLRVMRVSGFFTFPIFFGAAALGPEFIEFAFTEKWAQSGQVMTLLALGIAPLVIGYQVNAALTASGHAQRLMLLSSISFVLNCVFGLLLVPYGIIAAASGFALRSYLSIFFNMYFFKQVFSVSIRRQLRTIAPTFIASLIMLALLLAVKYLLLPHTTIALHPGLRLVLLAALGGLVYALIMSCIFRQETRDFLAEIGAMAPAKLKPGITFLQRLLRLNNQAQRD